MLISSIKTRIRFFKWISSLFTLLTIIIFLSPILPFGPVLYFLSRSFHLLPISFSQVVQVLRAIDRDEGGNDSAVHFNIPPDSSVALNFSIRESGGLQSPHSLSPAPPICFPIPSMCIRASLDLLVCVWNCIVWPLCVCSFVFPIVCFCFSATHLSSLCTHRYKLWSKM